MIKDYFCLRGNAIRRILEKNPEHAGLLPGVRVEEDRKGNVRYLLCLETEKELSKEMNKRNRLRRKYVFNDNVWFCMDLIGVPLTIGSWAYPMVAPPSISAAIPFVVMCTYCYVSMRKNVPQNRLMFSKRELDKLSSLERGVVEK